MDDLPIHTNKAIAIQKTKRRRISRKSQAAIDNGDIQSVIDSLTEKQRRFCEEYLIDLKPSQAVLRAGYETKYPNRIAFQLLENAAVRITIDALRMERDECTDVTKDYVLRKIVKTLEEAEKVKNFTAVLRAAELLARHKGMLVDRQEVSGPDGKEIEIRNKQTKEEADSFLELIDRTAKKSKLSIVE